MPDSHYNNYYGSILDPIHGDIKLSEIEKWILAQPIFSRLRRVKQNTFLYYVFPSSNHTRFEHSIGVLHLAGEIYKACKENYAVGEKKVEKFNLDRNDMFFDLNLLGERETTYYQELRLAALLHDIGHGPMSHMFDSFAASKDTFLKIINDNTVTNKYTIGFESLISRHGKVEHEAISCVFIFYLIDELKNVSIKDPSKFSQPDQRIIENISAERIVKMIEPKFEGLADISDDGKKRNYTPFFSRIITAFPIDADRMDYLLRDSYFSGTTYGIYDINRIFASFVPIQEDGIVQLGYKESGSDSMLRFIQSRAHLFNQVYFHKTNRGANTMLSHGTVSIRNEKLLDSCTSINDLIEFYVKNGDEYFLSNTLINRQREETEKAILSELINRKLFKRIYRHRITIDLNNKEESEKKSKEIEAIVDAIKEKLSALNSKYRDGDEILIYAAADNSENKNYKDSSTDKTVLLIKEDNNGGFKISDSWMDQSLEFKYLNLATFTIRIYVRRTFHNPNEYKGIRDKVMNEISKEIEKLEQLN